MSNKLNKIGRPTKYNLRIPKRVMNYTKTCIKTNDFPSIEGLSLHLGIGTRTIYDWEREFLEFSQTMEYLRDAQKDLLIKGGLTNKYNSRFASFLLKAIHGYSDTKPTISATQNNYFDVSPEVLAEALEITKQKQLG